MNKIGVVIGILILVVVLGGILVLSTNLVLDENAETTSIEKESFQSMAKAICYEPIGQDRGIPCSKGLEQEKGNCEITDPERCDETQGTGQVGTCLEYERQDRGIPCYTGLEQRKGNCEITDPERCDETQGTGQVGTCLGYEDQDRKVPCSRGLDQERENCEFEDPGRCL
jgi:hypothetical protein